VGLDQAHQLTKYEYSAISRFGDMASQISSLWPKYLGNHTTSGFEKILKNRPQGSLPSDQVRPNLIGRFSRNNMFLAVQQFLKFF
jgi:hypothetical protein